MKRVYWVFLGLVVLLLTFWKTKTKKREGLETWTHVSKAQWQTLEHQRSKAQVCIFSYDDRKNEPSIEKLKAINEAYCQKQGYEFLFFDRYPANLPPYWMKVKIAKDLVDSGKYNYVMWLDSDACVHNFNVRLESLFAFHRDAFFVMAPDHERWTSNFNAGVWALKCGTMAKHFLEDWLMLYDASKWSQTESRWSCQQCSWAGDAYEQGAGEKILKTETYAPYVIRLPWEILQNDTPTTLSFTLHFAGKMGKAQIKNYENTSFAIATTSQ